MFIIYYYSQEKVIVIFSDVLIGIIRLKMN